MSFSYNTLRYSQSSIEGAFFIFIGGKGMLTKVRYERLNRGLKQVEVVSLTGGKVSQARLSMIERGITPSPDEAVALADAFKLEPQELFQTA